MAKQSRLLPFFGLSIFLHGLFFVALLFLSDTNIEKQQNEQAVKSYLYVPKKPKPQPKPENTALENSAIVEAKPAEEVGIEPVAEVPAVLLEQVAETAVDKEVEEVPVPSAPKSNVDIRSGTAQLFQQLQSEKLADMASDAMREMRTQGPTSSRSSTPPTVNQQLRKQSESFAPKGSGVTVLSEFGGNETTVMHGDKCYQVTQTALDDKVWNGKSLWVGSNSCGNKFDKFDGQLQKSLDKFLKKSAQNPK